MSKINLLFIGLILFSVSLSCNTSNIEKGPHIVFVIGDEEYRSEESMPMLASILKRELNAKVSFCMSVDSAGYIDPNRTDYISNLSALDSADLMVLFTRFRNIPKADLSHIQEFAESGKPMVGFRTSTHAFLYKDSSFLHMNNEWPTKIFGQQWITHHGHFEDGNKPLTDISIRSANKSNSILNGVKPFKAYSWLYHVDGGNWTLSGNPNILLDGLALKSNHELNNKLDEFPMTNPVAWTKTYIGNKKKSARVFFTTLGHPYDFKEEAMRKLSLNGIYWALGLESKIPEDGVSSQLESSYNPNNSGFGQKYKKGQRMPNSVSILPK